MRCILILFFSLFGSFALAQNKQLLYNLSDLPQNLMTNPGAETSFDMHAGLPFLSQVHISAGSSGVTFYDIFSEDDISVNNKIHAAIHNLNDKDFFSLNQQVEILFLGWRDKKRRYYSAGIYQELDAFMYFPKDIAVLAYEGNRAHIGRNFHFSEAAFTAEVLNVFHIGFTNYYSKDLNYGVRAKLYSGVFNAQSINNRGTFRTVPSPEGPNIYRHFMTGLNATVQTSGWISLLESEDIMGHETRSSLTSKALLGGNLGLGIDLGFTYYLSDQYKISGSLLDIGFINQTKDVENYRYHGTYQTDGIELLFQGAGAGTPPYWDEWEDDLDRQLRDETYYDSYMTWRPLKFNASVDFGFDEDVEPCNCHKPTGRRKYFHHLGFQWFSIKRPRGFLHAATVSFDKRFSDKLTGKITYTADSFTFTNVGLLVSTRFNNFNFYLAADNILSYPNLARAHNASVQFGFNLILNRE